MPKEGPAPRRQARFELPGAIAADAGPWLGPVQVAAAAARVRVLHPVQHEVLLPVGPLLRERRRAKTRLDPPHSAIVADPRRLHVGEILAAGNRAPAER